MEKLFWSRTQWMTWEWHHPWTIAVGLTVLLAIYVASKISQR